MSYGKKPMAMLYWFIDQESGFRSPEGVVMYQRGQDRHPSITTFSSQEQILGIAAEGLAAAAICGDDHQGRLWGHLSEFMQGSRLPYSSKSESITKTSEHLLDFFYELRYFINLTPATQARIDAEVNQVYPDDECKVFEVIPPKTMPKLFSTNLEAQGVVMVKDGLSYAIHFVDSQDQALTSLGLYQPRLTPVDFETYTEVVKTSPTFRSTSESTPLVIEGKMAALLFRAHAYATAAVMRTQEVVGQGFPLTFQKLLRIQAAAQTN